MTDFELVTRPIWLGNEIYGESFLPMERKIKLLYHADEIIEVCDMRQSKIFVEGKDYVLEDGCLVIPENSDIKLLTWEQYNPQTADAEHHSQIGFVCENGGYLLFGEDGLLHNIQYQVTYRHSDSYKGYIPCADGERLPKIKAKLAQGRDIKFGFLGDSIPTGGNASGFMNIPPYLPIWPELICQRLAQKYNCKVDCDNKSVGGTTSGWGIDAAEGFKDTKYDIYLIAFGMNDASGRVDQHVYRDNIRKIADKLLTYSPDAELLFVSTTVPNPLAPQFVYNHVQHENLLAKLAGEYGDKADIVPMTTVHKDLQNFKHFYDMTGNNINHPNDFLVRVYAQTVLAVLGA